jgi:hypothetical protein
VPRARGQPLRLLALDRQCDSTAQFPRLVSALAGDAVTVPTQFLPQAQRARTTGVPRAATILLCIGLAPFLGWQSIHYKLNNPLNSYLLRGLFIAWQRASEEILRRVFL